MRRALCRLRPAFDSWRRANLSSGGDGAARGWTWSTRWAVFEALQVAGVLRDGSASEASGLRVQSFDHLLPGSGDDGAMVV